MFGDNPTRKLEKTSGDSLNVHSVFGTIQGEGPFAGLPATFIRLWGCHLKCSFCDTDFESTSSVEDISDLLVVCRGNGHRLVVLTGGEPMRQNIAPLCEMLHSAGHLVQIETAGSFPFQQEFKTRPPHLVISPKTATVHPRLMNIAQAWKYIIDTDDERDEDGLPIVDFQATGNKAALAKPPAGTPPEFIWLQPCDRGEPLANAANLELCVALAKHHGYRVSIQQHKIMGVP